MRLRLAAMAKLLLSQWSQGYDACRSVGEPPSDIGLYNMPTADFDAAGVADPLTGTA